MSLWTPALISTSLWLDASDGASITLVSGKVSQWNDKSGNSRHATQGTAANRPTVSSAALNSKDVVSFASANSTRMSIGALFGNTSSADLSAFVVGKRTSGSPGVFISTRVDSPSGMGWTIRDASTPALTYFHVGLPEVLSKSSASADTWYLAEVVRDGLNIELGVDGSFNSSSAISGFNAVTSGSTWLGAEDAGTSSFLNGGIAEIILVDSTVDSITRQKIEGYLAYRWGLQSRLPSGHPYKTNPPSVPDLQPGSIVVHPSFGAVQLSAAATAAVLSPDHIFAKVQLGAARLVPLLHIVQPGSIDARGRFGAIVVSEPSFTVEATLETIIESNEYTVEVTLETVIQSAIYSVEATLETIIEPNEYTVEVTLETVIQSAPYTVEATLKTVVFDRGVLDGHWTPLVAIDGIVIDNETIIGAVTVRASRSVSRTAEFSYVLDAAVAEEFNVLHFHRKLVTIDAVSGSQSIRRFTGQVQAPQWDAKERIVTLHCADFFEESLMRLDFVNVAALAQSTSWSDVVFGEAPATAREYLDQLLELSPVSVQCDAYGLLHAAPLLPTGSVATLTADDIEDGTQDVSLADTKQIVNKFEVELTTRGAACYGAIYRVSYKMGQSLTPPIGFSGPRWTYVIYLNGKLMQRSMIEQAVNSTGWRLLGDVNFVAPTDGTKYTTPGGTDVVFTVKPAVAEQLAVEFTANMRLEWAQTVEVKDKIVVAWNSSIATYGELSETERYLADTDFDAQAWEASKRDEIQKTADSNVLAWGGMYTDADGSSSGGGIVGGKGYGDEPHVGQGVVIKAGKNSQGWGYSTQAIACIVKRCQNEILKSALANTYSCSLMRIAPGIEIGDGLTPAAGTIVTSESALSVAGFTDVWNFENMDFHTELEMQFIPVTGSATEYSSTPVAFPAPTFAANYTSIEGSSPFFTTTPVAYYGESEGGEQRMEITLPAVPDQYRETESQDRTSSPLNHGIWWSANNLTIEAPERI